MTEEAKHTPTAGIEPDAVDLVEVLLEKFAERYPEDIARMFSRAQARTIISNALAGYGSRANGTSGAYAFLGIMDAIGVKGWAYQPGHEPELTTLRTKLAEAERANAASATAIEEAMQDGKGFWRSCSGCHELNEGHPTGPYSKTFKCHIGVGCYECGGIGALWDTTDYADMGAFLSQAQDPS